MSKIGIIGVGHVGAHCAYTLAITNTIDEIFLIDLKPEKILSEKYDINDSLVNFGLKSKVKTGNYDDITDADILVLSVGKIIGNRLNELETSKAMLDDVILKIQSSGFGGIIISITNPCDIMTYYALNKLNWDKYKCFGTGTALDSTRLVGELSEYTSISPKSITAYVLGEHGDSQFVSWSTVRFGNFTIEDFKKFYSPQYCSFDSAKKAEIADNVRNRAGIIYPPKNATEYGIATTLTKIVSAIVNDEKIICPLSVLLNGEYNEQDICLSTPCVIDKNGIEAILELPITDDELISLKKSAEIIRDKIKLL
ncbi:MAG: L-lactate dehydrogenase [Oscillospiraceae bacterium]|nr:L-lactate dehydrogenase [Oscillospiraceae bacterium]